MFEFTEDENILTRSWPILVAVIPALVNYHSGNADLWSDFIMILFILFYVYQWLTVPWAYYESAQYRYQEHHHHPIRSYSAKYLKIKKELRRHECLGLVLVTLSPIIGGYLLQYSRHILSSADKYVNDFNVTVFIIGASIKPITHAMKLFSQGRLYLQSEKYDANQSQICYLQEKATRLQNELQLLKLAYVTKQDLGEATNEIHPSLTELSTTLTCFDQREEEWKEQTEVQFDVMESKVQELDEFMFYQLQRQRERSSIIIQLLQLPIQISIWLAKNTSF